MCHEEGSIYFLDTINDGALLQKRQANLTLSDRSWVVLPYALVNLDEMQIPLSVQRSSIINLRTNNSLFPISICH